MRSLLKNHILILLGWFFVALGIVGALLPILPTTPFLILALALFSKSSPKFHKMLIENKWFGPTLKQWEASRTLSRKTKYRTTILIVLTFSISVVMLAGRLELQAMLMTLALVLLFLIWRIKE